MSTSLFMQDTIEWCNVEYFEAVSVFEEDRDHACMP